MDLKGISLIFGVFDDSLLVVSTCSTLKNHQIIIINWQLHLFFYNLAKNDEKPQPTFNILLLNWFQVPEKPISGRYPINCITIENQKSIFNPFGLRHSFQIILHHQTIDWIFSFILAVESVLKKTYFMSGNL